MNANLQLKGTTISMEDMVIVAWEVHETKLTEENCTKNIRGTISMGHLWVHGIGKFISSKISKNKQE